MSIKHFPIITALFLCSVDLSSAADCNTAQQRQSGDPSGVQIAHALQKNDALDSVCSNSWSSSSRSKTYNEGNIIYNVTRSNTNDAPTDNACKPGFQNIISECISGDNYWGGRYTYNAFTYAIYNSIYPSNGLPSYDYTTSGASSVESTHGTNAQTGNGPTGIPAAGTPNPTHTSSKDGGSSASAGSDSSSSVAAIPGETIVTETNSAGSQIVGTFVPTTLSQYATLKTQTTITTTTTRDGVPVVFPLVIGVGGVAWAIIGGVPPAGITPPSAPPGSEGGDDPPDQNPSNQVTQHTAPRTTFHRTTATTRSSSASISSSAAASTSASGRVVTAIDDTPYPNIAAIQAAFIMPQGPLPDGDDSISSSSSGSSITTQTKSNSAIPSSTPVSSSSTKTPTSQTGAHLPGSTQYGPSQYCQGLSPGAGSDTCTDVPAGCYIVIPGYNVIPQPVCSSSSSSTITAAPATTTAGGGAATTTALHC
ncbi:MAG: hypothetical protein Q9212_004775, partial [Teloschistes hypoglaucus]